MADALDKVDIAIADRLQRDGRLSNVKLAEQLCLSEASCWRKQKRLEASGVIEGYQAILNRKKLGLGVMAFVQISCTDHSEEATAKFEKIIAAAPQVLSCHNTTGEADFLLQVVAQDLDSYSRFIDKVLRKLPGVASIRSNLSLREMKTTNQFPVAELLSL
ncbi:Lrp/AsnC family transcriptional regulator [Pseudomonas juntendi]|jgi:DNA-binding Lrp family transcriptional regulator|uniref:Lrp/AsnC family transcriptional regulator n=1 Tax=Pseudomonas juntendi TaxID=2666183 RepID=A0ABZ2JLR9_9PSED|nr:MULTISPECIES: Lrp/AsnC family transcriptional regulator [Pseudomonas]MBH3376194.1 Lrp/AsnC family transcriptional regulator [Pseudomonas juntendi]MBS6040748.1 Lrp/AsnC family transcriptional regulator [Pseudomonas sp.]MDH2016732.1 Lrp/AsnC family transcriptional regulator [Pseudomonas juntendi]QDR68545.1 Lrp/AsnC family transcriptional regulator [Pseudomonas sp. BJP69]WHL27143.1 Lrp/AsnC family transcriptional regulator [Pseudomonas juntendi]